MQISHSISSFNNTGFYVNSYTRLYKNNLFAELTVSDRCARGQSSDNRRIKIVQFGVRECQTKMTFHPIYEVADHELFFLALPGQELMLI